MTAIFIGLFAFILGAVLLINNSFLGTYYLSHKTDELIRTYHQIDMALEDGDLSENTSARQNILIRTERANVDLVVVDDGGDRGSGRCFSAFCSSAL